MKKIILLTSLFLYCMPNLFAQSEISKDAQHISGNQQNPSNRSGSFLVLNGRAAINSKSTLSVCGNGIVEPGEECDGTPGCNNCALLPAGTYFVEPNYGVKYITNLDGALRTSNRSIKLNTTTNQFMLATNHQFQSLNYSFGGTSSIDANGTNSNQAYVSSPSGNNLNKNFPLPIAGNDFIANLIGENTDPKGIDVRSLADPSLLKKRIIPSDVGEIDLDIYAATVQADGKLLLAGRCVLSQGRIIVIRLNTNYTLDTTFNAVGYIKLAFGSDSQARAIGLQSTGKIIVAGHRAAPGSIGIVARINTDGTLDTTFGTNGSQLFNYEVWTQDNTFVLDTTSEVYSMYINASDGIYLCGTGSSSTLWSGKSIPTFNALTSNGNNWLVMRDPNHTTATSFFNIEGCAYKIAKANASGDLYVSGFSSLTSNKGLYLQKYSSVGSVATDFSFKSGSQESFYDLSSDDDIIYDLAVQNDGKIILIGESNTLGFYTRLMNSTLGMPLIQTEDKKVTLWPNPVRNSLNIEFHAAINEPIDVAIIDVSGKEILRIANPIIQSQSSIMLPNLEVLPNGVYILKITSNGKPQSIEFIKQD